MNSVRDAHHTAHSKAWRPAALIFLLLLLGLLPGLVALALVLSQGPGAAVGSVVLLVWSSLLALGLTAGLSGWLARRLTLQSLGVSQQALQAQNQRWQQLLQSHGHALWRSDAQHRLLAASPQAGLPAGSPLWEFFGLQHGQAAELRPDVPALQRLLQQQPAELSCQLRELGADGAEWSVQGLACLDEAGRFQGYQGWLKRVAVAAPPGPAAPAGPSLLGSLADAAQLQVATELRLQAQMQAQAFEAQEQASFSYTVSHDLRAPLRVVEGFARILKEDYGRLLDRIGNDHLDRVMGAASRMNSMIDSLLSLSQLSSQPLARQPVNLSQLAGYVLEELQRGAPQRKVNLHVQAQMVVQGDPVLLRMVLENLLGNAWKYSGKCEAAEIRFEAQQEQGLWTYRVSDNGAGFDMRFADRLFGVFQRLHSASDFQGTGVGLASVRRIVRRHGGEVWAESEVGAGARFYFTLPG